MVTYGSPPLPPQNAPGAAQPQVGVQPGVAQAVVIANQVIITGAGGGIFVYSPAPGPGDLIGSWSGTAGTDPYGNSYPAGLNVLEGTISGTDISGGTITGSAIIAEGSSGEILAYSGTTPQEPGTPYGAVSVSSSGDVTSQTVTISSAITQNDLLFVVCRMGTTSTVVTGVSDSSGAVWAWKNDPSPQYRGFAIAWTGAPRDLSSGTTITVSLNTSQTVTLVAFAVPGNGLGQGAAQDQLAWNGSASAISSLSVDFTPAKVSEIAIGVQVAGGTPTATGWTSIDNPAGIGAWYQYPSQDVASAFTVDFSPAQAVDMAVVTFAPPGTLIASISGQAGTDQYGNSYPAGLGIFGGNAEINGDNYVIDDNGMVFYDGNPTESAVVFALASQPFTDAYGNNIPAGIFYGANQVSGVNVVSYLPAAVEVTAVSPSTTILSDLSVILWAQTRYVIQGYFTCLQGATGATQWVGFASDLSASEIHWVSYAIADSTTMAGSNVYTARSEGAATSALVEVPAWAAGTYFVVEFEGIVNPAGTFPAGQYMNGYGALTTSGDTFTVLSAFFSATPISS